MKERTIEKLESIEDAKIAFEEANPGLRVLMGMEYNDSYILLAKETKELKSAIPEYYRIRKQDNKLTMFLPSSDIEGFFEAMERSAINFT